VDGVRQAILVLKELLADRQSARAHTQTGTKYHAQHSVLPTQRAQVAHKIQRVVGAHTTASATKQHQLHVLIHWRRATVVRLATVLNIPRVPPAFPTQNVAGATDRASAFQLRVIPRALTITYKVIAIRVHRTTRAPRAHHVPRVNG